LYIVIVILAFLLFEHIRIVLCCIEYVHCTFHLCVGLFTVCYRAAWKA